jgi:hypothetical protein
MAKKNHRKETEIKKMEPILALRAQLPVYYNCTLKFNIEYGGDAKTFNGLSCSNIPGKEFS